MMHGLSSGFNLEEYKWAIDAIPIVDMYFSISFFQSTFPHIFRIDVFSIL